MLMTSLTNKQTNPAQPATQRWDFWIDRGGTFTDIVAKDGHSLKSFYLKTQAPMRMQHCKVFANFSTLKATVLFPPNSLAA
jgi:hypothetical protein